MVVVITMLVMSTFEGKDHVQPMGSQKFCCLGPWRLGPDISRVDLPSDEYLSYIEALRVGFWCLSFWPLRDISSHNPLPKRAPARRFLRSAASGLRVSGLVPLLKQEAILQRRHDKTVLS